ncbi:MAG TPA: phosphoribosylformylglycinamidine cyclo-ligase [Thermoanaerobaculia bacterium]|nr:phosphoribosylformylglycinamidine cyclo-ligase [Thermoanaerobaculia bacterium]
MKGPLDRLLKRSAYKDAGVDIDVQERALARVKELARGTATTGTLGGVGGFGGLFQLDLDGVDEPVLVSSADGVGTKLAVARMAGEYGTVGRDLVNHCVNDILVQGARPLFFLDYVGSGALDPEALVALVRGVADGCKENGCALLGGETAEMPGFYRSGDYELVGFIVGLVDRAALLDGSRVEAGDVLVGLPSSGLHTNGYSLVRKILFERLDLAIDAPAPWVTEGRRTVAQELLAVHRSYLKPLAPLLRHPGLHGLAHVTGGGLTDNLPRMLPAGTGAHVRLGTWEIPPLFPFLQDHGEVEDDEMLRVFNLGVGMVAAVDPEALAEVLASLRASGERSFVLGTVTEGDGGVVYDLGEGRPEHHSGAAAAPAGSGADGGGTG